MGEFNVKRVDNPESIRRFTHYILKDLKALEDMLSRDMFETDVQRIGAEQELCLIDKFWRPAPIIEEVLTAINDPHFTTELAKFNLEINLEPVEFTGDCFSRIEQQLTTCLGKLEKVLHRMGAEYILVGILPTIRYIDLEMENMTRRKRYALLFEKIRELRGGDFQYNIKGIDELITQQEYPTFEFCNTSFQVHFQTTPKDFPDAYNFSKLIAAPVLAAATNSPLLVGKRLWHETRIALFQQAIDTRNVLHHLREKRGRVSFPKQWIHHSVLEILQDDIARFRILLCSENYEDSLKVLKSGEIPKLKALNTFNGTVYRWNRACYGVFNGKPHLRIENRTLPAGPTVKDEIANAAFWSGLMNAIPEEYKNLPGKIEFDEVVTNFIKAARLGLDSTFTWLNNKTVNARDLILKELLPLSREGLQKAGVHSEDIQQNLELIEQRVRRKKTGSQWMLDSFAKLKEEGTLEETLVAITAAIVHRQKKGKPVYQWKLAKLTEAGNWINKFLRVEQIMSTELFTVQEDDLIDLVANIMDWKHIRHVPVENENGSLVGLITSGILLKHYGKTLERLQNFTPVKEIMIHDPIYTTPETLTTDAIKVMRKNKIGCLPVVKGDKLVGIVTEHDFVKISARLLEQIFEEN